MKEITFDFSKHSKQKHFENKKQEMTVRYQNLQDVEKILNEGNVQHWLYGKTLLGIYRDFNLIKDDHDEDIGLFKKDLEYVYRVLIPKMEKIGFKVIRITKNNDIVSVMRNNRYVDLCFFSEKENNLIGYENKKIPIEYIGKTENFLGFQIPIDARKILKLLYNYSIYCRLVYEVEGRKVIPEFFNKINWYKCSCCLSSKIKHVICDPLDTPHYEMVSKGDEQLYDKYMKEAGKYAGYGLEHSLENYKNLIKNFNFEKAGDIKVQNGIIVDGLHRFCILHHKFRN